MMKLDFCYIPEIFNEERKTRASKMAKKKKKKIMTTRPCSTVNKVRKFVEQSQMIVF